MGLTWQALSALREQWEINVEALRARDPALAGALESHRPGCEMLFAAETHQVRLARQINGQIEVLPNPIPPGSAGDIALKLFPTGKCTEPAMVAGLDQGWLWHALHGLECDTPRTPGHRPPLYFLASDIERLWIALHLHDWTALLGDERVRLFVGSDAARQCQASMIANHHVPWAKLCATVDPNVWPAGMSVDSMWQAAHAAANARMQQLTLKLDALYAGTDGKAIVRKLRGETLRVLGITSRFTTFLKHSMGDWIDAMARLGHETRIAIEQADHEVANPVFYAEAVADFRPDIIFMIDHYRAEIAGLPKPIPCVMWVQDQLPNIFSAKAGTAQGPRDYCVGFGRLHLRDKFGYPEQRFMPAQVGVNEDRFTPDELTESERAQYECDISFVSHASAPATVLLTEQINRADSLGRKLLIDVFEQMRAVYDSGGCITQPLVLREMIEQAVRRCKIRFDEPMATSVLEFFNQKVNNALFRHQALSWAAEMDVNLHVYGRGWENHPRFARYAKGIACNQTQLSLINRASRINLQLMPSGAVHQRLFDGLTAGGFFMLRYVPGDTIETIYRKLHDWCRENDVTTDDELKDRATPEVVAMLAEAKKLVGLDPFAIGYSMIDVLKLSADGEYIRSAATIWDEYDRVSFGSAAQFRQRAEHFLTHADERRAIARSMRQVVLNRFTYRSVTQRLLQFVADDLATQSVRALAA